MAGKHENQKEIIIRTYASRAAALTERKLTERTVPYSIVVTSKNEMDRAGNFGLGKEYDKSKKDIIVVESVRTARNRKLIKGYKRKEEKEAIKE